MVNQFYSKHDIEVQPLMKFLATINDIKNKFLKIYLLPSVDQKENYYVEQSLFLQVNRVPIDDT
jgi:hypothetical protein